MLGLTRKIIDLLYSFACNQESYMILRSISFAVSSVSSLFLFLFVSICFSICFSISLGTDEDGNPNFDVEDFLLRAIFLNLYNFGSFISYCAPYQDCDNGCIKCPEKNYNSFADLVSVIQLCRMNFILTSSFWFQVRLPCSQLIINCTWNDTPFECCRYFLPIKTTLGRCFILNSIQLTEK